MINNCFVFNGTDYKLLREKRGGYIFYWAMRYGYWSLKKFCLLELGNVQPIYPKDVINDLYNCENIAGVFRWSERHDIFENYFGEDKRQWPNAEV